MNDLNKLAKVDLHCHLDGSVRISTLYELLLKESAIEKQEVDEFKKLISVGDSCDSLKEYLDKFQWPLKVMQSEENLERISYEILEDFAKENIIYGEIRFAPYLHMEKGLSFDQVVEAVLRGKRRAEKEFSIKSNLILIAMRHESPEMSMELVKKGEKFLGEGVVAVDLAGNEEDFPPEIHKEAFKLAEDLGYHITVHAGETGISQNIRTSIEELGAERIGHGIAAIKDSDLMEYIYRNNIYLEMCPISNLDTKAILDIKFYPIKEFIKRGINVTINTDNTTVSNTSLEKEYRLLMEELDFKIGDIKELIKSSINAAFISKKEKEDLLVKLENSIGEE